MSVILLHTEAFTSDINEHIDNLMNYHFVPITALLLNDLGLLLKTVFSVNCVSQNNIND